MRPVSILFLPFVFLCGSSASAAIYEQLPPSTSPRGIQSSVIADEPQYSTFTMDDFTVTESGWAISAISCAGLVSDGGSFGTTMESPFHIRISAAASFTSPGAIAYSATKPSGLITPGWVSVDGLTATLAPGHYWLTAWAEGVALNAWYWGKTNDGPFGDGAYVQNPGGGFGIGTEPIAVLTATGNEWRDQAFRIMYEPLPEPSTIAAVLMGCAWLASRRKRRRLTCKGTIPPPSHGWRTDCSLPRAT